MDPRAARPSRRGLAPTLARPGPAGWGRLVASVAFERALAKPAAARTPHFALHRDLSTSEGSSAPEPVDNQPGAVHGAVDDTVLPAALRALGLVVPKRHAKRAVTRTLLKRQIRSVARSAGADLADGLWVVRLRAPFDRAGFPSAASAALRRAARGELEALFADRALPRRLSPGSR